MNKNKDSLGLIRDRGFTKQSKLSLFFFCYYTFFYLAIPAVRTYESSAWRMITDRFLANDIFGRGSFGGLLVIFPETSKKISQESLFSVGTVNARDMFAFGSSSVKDPEIYTSQFGLIGDVGGFLQTYLNVSPFSLYIIFTFVCLALTSTILARIILIFSQNFGRRAALVSLITFLTPWPILHASNFYYTMYLNLAFLIIPIEIRNMLQRKNREEYFQKALWIFLAIFTFFLSLTNYTYVTVWVSCLVIGITISSKDKQLILRNYLKPIGALGIGLISAIICHLIRVKSYATSIKGTNWIEYVLRNKMGLAHGNIPTEYQESINKSPLDVLDLYLKEPLTTRWLQNKLPDILGYANGYLLLAISLVVLLYCVFRKVGPCGRLVSLGRLNLIAISGPLSWILLMRPHSWDNAHLNYIFLFLPAIPLLFATLLAQLESERIGVDRLQLPRVELILIPTLITLFLLSYLVFWLL